MRRKDREITSQADILAVLDACEVMRVGFCEGNTPYIVPMNFAYEIANGAVALYFHCAPQGRKLDMLSKNSRVCFEADCGFHALPAERACEWSAEYRSVIGEGEISVVTDITHKEAALDLIMKRYGFEGKPNYGAKELSAVTVLKITAHSITGKAKVKNR